MEYHITCHSKQSKLIGRLRMWDCKHNPFVHRVFFLSGSALRFASKLSQWFPADQCGNCRLHQQIGQVAASWVGRWVVCKVVYSICHVHRMYVCSWCTRLKLAMWIIVKFIFVNASWLFWMVEIPKHQRIVGEDCWIFLWRLKAHLESFSLTDSRSGLVAEGLVYCFQHFQGRLQEAPLGHKGGRVRKGTSVCGPSWLRVMKEAGVYLDRNLFQYIGHVDRTLDFHIWCQNMAMCMCGLC